MLRSISFVGVASLTALGACGGSSRDGGQSGSDEGAEGISLNGITATDSASSQAATAEDDGDGNEEKLDAQPSGDLGVNGCAGDSQGGGGMNTGGDGDLEFSYIWVANSGEGTMSKIDTRTLEEKGRFIVRPDSAGNPSRTSVNLSGDVAIANRAGGLTKVSAVEERCVDTNGDGVITTSTTNVPLPWGSDECVLWHTPYQT
ncbi:MAG: hypothetical protein IAG13_26205, partial [Deltaproteobacteria bacterium]|nr:hypothetical protein [Nannocystaceae bacterium]